MNYCCNESCRRELVDGMCPECMPASEVAVVLRENAKMRAMLTDWQKKKMDVRDSDPDERGYA